MAYDLYYTMLFTDQGMGNLVSITNRGQNAIQFSALIDFGTAQSSLTKESVDFMERYIRGNRAANKPGPDLDLVVVSHQDNDHWSLFPSLIARFANSNPQLRIGTVTFGGNFANYSEGAKAAVNQLWGLAPAAGRILLPATEISAYAANNPQAPLAQFPANNPEITFQPVIGNVPAVANKPDIVANTVSLLIGVFWVENNDTYNVLLLPGDMTSCTIYGLYKMRDRLGRMKNTYTLSVPHHGSHRTLSDNYNSTIASRTFTFASWFAGQITPNSLGISAGFTSNHRHPYHSVIEIFQDDVIDGFTAHNYVAYDIENAGYQQYNTTTGIFTNYNDIPANWNQKRKNKKRKYDPGNVAGRIVVKIIPGTITYYSLPIDSASNPGLA
ncbi:hypothetical protein [Methylobacterium sp. JK268]